VTTEYELTYLADANLSDEARAELDTAVDAFVSELGGSISYSSPSLRRRLFYPIAKKAAAFSRALQISVDPLKIEELRKNIRRREGVLRLYVIRTPRRQEVTPEAFTDALEGGSRQTEARIKASKKKVSMQDVEAGIEEALQEEVK
jgi:ribosomal protein S6